MRSHLHARQVSSLWEGWNPADELIRSIAALYGNEVRQNCATNNSCAYRTTLIIDTLVEANLKVLSFKGNGALNEVPRTIPVLNVSFILLKEILRTRWNALQYQRFEYNKDVR